MLESKCPNIPTYNDLQKGRHPDISDALANKLPPDERRYLSVNLTLRDIFTPLCKDINETVLSMPSEKIRGISEDFDEEPKKFLFTRSFEDLVKQIEDLKDSFWDLRKQTTTSLSPEAYQKKRKEHQILLNVVEMMRVNTSPQKIDRKDILDCVPGQFSEFYYAPTEIFREQSWDTLFMPVLGYGEETTKKALQAGRVLTLMTDIMHADDAKSLADNYEDILKDTTARAKSYVPPRESSDEINRYYPLLTAEEGIESLLGSIAFLLPEKINSIEDGDAAINAVIKNRLPNQLAGRIHMGFLMPKLRAGKYLPGIIETYGDKLKFSNEAENLFDTKMKNDRDKRDKPDTQIQEVIDSSPELKSMFANSEKVMRDLFIKTGRDPDELITLSGITGYGCPVARKSPHLKESGIQLLSEAFLHIYNSL